MRLMIGALALAAALAVGTTAASAIDEKPSRPARLTSMAGFGGAVAVGDGEVFVAEAQNSYRPNTVYVYRKNAGGWAQAAKLVAPPSGPNGSMAIPFGTSLALEGNTLFIGGGPAKVFVFRKTGTSWAAAGSIEATSAGAADIRFGNSMSASGDWLMIGRTPQSGPPPVAGRPGIAPPSGAVYAFRRDGSGQYSYATTIVNPGDSASRANDLFGMAVAVNGTTMFVGAPGQSSQAGLVHEFKLENGAWKSQRSFAPVGAGNNDRFGAQIALRDDYALITAAGEGGAYGATYIYRNYSPAGRVGAPPPEKSWREFSRLASPAGARNDQFGFSLAIGDKDMVVGAPAAARDGGAFVFARDSAGVKVGTQFLTQSGLLNGGRVGMSVGIRNNVLAIGASGVERGAGAVLIFEKNAAGTWVKQPMLRVPLDELVAQSGPEKKCGGDGKLGVFECSNSSLVAFVPPSKMTWDGHYIPMNDIWGWTDPVTKKEWALVGRRDGTTFVDMSNPSNPIPVADLPMTTGSTAQAWRDIKVYKDHAFIVADNSGAHGMQVFDLTRLRTIKPVGGLPAKVAYDTIYRMINSAHNIVINEESGYAYSVGSSSGGTTCGGGLHMIDIREPKKPTFAGCFADPGTGRSGTGYSHDAQCVMYKGPDKRYTGHEICLGSNETAISVADVTDKKNPKALSHASYPNVAYAHQGWFDDEHRYFYLDDEVDELNFPDAIKTTRTLVWDLADLENPRLAKEYMGVATSSDHNLYIIGNQLYQANYASGLRILDITNRENPKEVSFFDTHPYATTAGFEGAWSVYPYFKSGNIIVNSIGEGLFILKQGNRVVF